MYYDLNKRTSKTANYSMANRLKVTRLEADKISITQLNWIAKGIIQYFSEVEIFDLMMDLDYDPNTFVADPKKRAYDFVLLVNREGNINTLITRLIVKRPHFDWKSYEGVI